MTDTAIQSYNANFILCNKHHQLMSLQNDTEVQQLHKNHSKNDDNLTNCIHH